MSDIVDLYLHDLKTKFNKIKPNEYYLSYSGGKDSHLLYWFIKEYAPEFSDIKVVRDKYIYGASRNKKKDI